jgi:flavorubredoxin
MIQVTQIANGIHRISFSDEKEMEGMTFPGTTTNAFLIAAARPVIIQTLYRRTFKKLHQAVGQILDPASLRYVIVPHHEGDSSGAINEWLAAAPQADAVCSELCAILSLRDFADREPVVVKDDQVLDLGTHRLRFLITPQVNQWDSLMAYEETTRTLFPNDLFSMAGLEVTEERDISQENLDTARKFGYQPDDRAGLKRALDKVAPLELKAIAPMHGPVITAHFDKLIRCFRENSLTAAASV